MPPDEPGERDRPAWLGISRPCWAITLAAVPLHLALALATDLSPDEAYYLAAARSSGLVPRMVDHPPLLVWMLRATDVAGPVELRVRVWAIVLSLATSLAAVSLARARGADARTAQITAWIVSWALLPTAGAFVTTPDGPLLLLFTIALLLAARAKPLAAAACLGLAVVAKVVALPLAAVVALADRRLRWPLTVACALAAPLALPSLRFQLVHAFADRPSAWSLGAALGAVLAAAAAQAALWTPFSLTRGFSAIRRGPTLDRSLVVALTALLLVSAVARAFPPEPNWWAPAGLLLAIAASRAERPAPRALILVVLLPTAIASLHTLHPFLPIARAADPTARLHGWQTPATEPLDAPGIGAYGPAAERCIYRNMCSELRFNSE
jgi:hypothetical protein